MSKRIAVVGGAGYIGSFTVRELLGRGNTVDVIDDLSTGHREAIDSRATLFEIDIYSEEKKLREHFRTYGYDGVIHFAAKALVGESVFKPREYYETNVIGSLNLFKAATDGDCKRIVFSSTCATYGVPVGELTEAHQTKPVNPYGNTKLIAEFMLSDLAASDTTGGAKKPLKAIALRYFNACGAEPSVCLGEDHIPESHLIPNVIKAGLGQTPALKVFGSDYPTKDGTAVRDYIHVVDLADAHLRALDHLDVSTNPFEVFNVGTGNGSSIKEVINAVEDEIGEKVPHEYADRRPGDPPALVASSAKLQQATGWKPKRSDIKGVIKDAVAWHRARPAGYN